MRGKQITRRRAVAGSAALVALVFGLFDFSDGGAADAARAAIWLGAQPWRMRDFLSWLFARPGRARSFGGALAAYGLLLAGVAFSY